MLKIRQTYVKNILIVTYLDFVATQGDITI